MYHGRESIIRKQVQVCQYFRKIAQTPLTLEPLRVLLLGTTTTLPNYFLGLYSQGNLRVDSEVQLNVLTSTYYCFHK